MSTTPQRPAEWADRLAKLYTPVVADVLDRLGFRHQAMHALSPATTSVVGR